MDAIIIKMLETKRYTLSYSPFPRRREEKEYIVGEALLRSQGVQFDVLKSLKGMEVSAVSLIFTILLR